LSLFVDELISMWRSPASPPAKASRRSRRILRRQASRNWDDSVQSLESRARAAQQKRGNRPVCHEWHGTCIRGPGSPCHRARGHV